MVIGVSLVEIASSFDVNIALAGQLGSISSFLAILIALVMGVLSVRYSYKTLLLAGPVLNLASIISCGLAPSFSLLVICFSSVGIVTSIVVPIISAYIGEIYPTRHVRRL